MKIKKISDIAIMVEMTSDDLEQRGMNISRINTDAPVYRKMLRDLVAYAEIELGIDISTVRVKMNIEGDTEKEKVARFYLTDISDPHGARESGRENSSDGESIFTRNSGADAAEGGSLGDLIKKLIVDRIQSLAIAESLGALLKESAENAAAGRNADGPDELSDESEWNRGEDENDGSDENEEENDGRYYGFKDVNEALAGRRKYMYGEDYAEKGGTGAFAFENYSDLYKFTRECGIPSGIKSSLYEYKDVFYLVVTTTERSAALLDKLDNYLFEYRAVPVQGVTAAEILDAFGTPVFKTGAVKKIKQSM